MVVLARECVYIISLFLNTDINILTISKRLFLEKYRGVLQNAICSNKPAVDYRLIREHHVLFCF